METPKHCNPTIHPQPVRLERSTQHLLVWPIGCCPAHPGQEKERPPQEMENPCENKGENHLEMDQHFMKMLGLLSTIIIRLSLDQKWPVLFNPCESACDVLLLDGSCLDPTPGREMMRKWPASCDTRNLTCQLHGLRFQTLYSILVWTNHVSVEQGFFFDSWIVDQYGPVVTARKTARFCSKEWHILPTSSVAASARSEVQSSNSSTGRCKHYARTK